MEKCVVDYLPNRRGESSASLANRSDSRFFWGGRISECQAERGFGSAEMEAAGSQLPHGN